MPASTGMILSDFATDGWTALDVLARPARGLAAVAARPRAGAALLLAMALSLSAAAVVVPRTDYGEGAVPTGEGAGAPAAPEPTAFERAQAAATARKLGQVVDVAAAVALPAILAGIAACALALAFRAAGAEVATSSAFAVAAHGLLPVWLARALAIPAALAHAPVARAEVARLLPSSAAALLPPGAAPALQGALGALDLFALWAVWLVARGMSRVSGVSPARALALTLTLYACAAALARVALPSLLAGSPPSSP